MTDAESISIVGMFMAAYPSTNADDGTVDLWVQALATVAPSEGRQAAMEWISRSKFFPTIADIREILASYRRQRDLSFSGRMVGERTVSFEDGVKFMLDGYLAECRSQGRQPTPAIVKAMQRGEFPNVGVA